VPEVSVSPSRIAKKLSRRVKVSWREQPTRYDIEALQANIQRVGLVIRVRWALVAALTLYSIVGTSVYMQIVPLTELVPNMVVPAIALIFVLAYNSFYHATYRQLGNIAVLNHAQLLFDAIVVTVLVHYSGGVHSWFWAMYPLFVLEAAFILPRHRDAWFIAWASIGMLATVELGEFAGIIPSIPMPFISNELYGHPALLMVRFLWQVTVICGTAMVATLMMDAVRSRERLLAGTSITDAKTGLCNRAYFMRTLASEVLRARRDGRPLFVALIDVDDLDRFNHLFGIERGDRLLRALSEAFVRTLGECTPGAPRDANSVCRYGGEEFGVLLVETSSGAPFAAEEALDVAHALRESAAAVRIEDAGVTVSIGLSRFPEDGTTVDELLDVADESLHRAAVSGGNTVVMLEGGAGASGHLG
jgi:diguanylate cyclase (GGDEF)-like protein